MIQIPANKLFDSKAASRDFINRYFTDNAYTFTVSGQEQQATLKQLSDDLDREQFHFVIDIREQQITSCLGVSRWLGYNDNHFLLTDYIGILHPAHAVVQACFGYATCSLLLLHPVALQYMQPLCTATIALRHQQGHYLHCKRQCLPFQFTATQKLTAYLCCFTIIKVYVQEEYHARLSDRLPHYRQLAQVLESKAREQLGSSKTFSTQELRILKRYAATATATSDTVATAFKIKRATVATYNKRIINKTEDLFHQRFADAKQAATYLKRMCLL